MNNNLILNYNDINKTNTRGYLEMFAVEIKDLNKKFGDFTAVNNLSLKIR
ncbi:MAG: hypothetical protein ACRC6T_08040 [Sarcina sp.]